MKKKLKEVWDEVRNADKTAFLTQWIIAICMIYGAFAARDIWELDEKKEELSIINKDLSKANEEKIELEATIVSQKDKLKTIEKENEKFLKSGQMLRATNTALRSAFSNDTKNHDINILLAAEASNQDKSGHSTDALLRVLDRYPSLIKYHHFNENIKKVKFDGNNNYIGIALKNKVVLFEGYDTKEIIELTSESDQIYDFAFLNRSKQIVICGSAGIELWDIKTKRIVSTRDNKDIRLVTISSDDTVLATADNKHVVVVWDVSTDGQVSLSPRPEQIKDRNNNGYNEVNGKRVYSNWYIGDMELSSDGSYLALIFSGRYIIRDLKSNKTIVSEPRKNINSTTSIAFSPVNNILAIGNNNGQIEIWNPADKSRPIKILTDADELQRSINHMAFSQDGKELAVIMSSNKIRYWDVEKKLVKGEKAYYGKLFDISINPNNLDQYATINLDISASVLRVKYKRLALWDASRLSRLVYSLPTQENWIGASFEIDSNNLISTTADGESYIWDYMEATLGYRHIKNLDKIPNFRGYVTKQAISPDGKSFALLVRDKKYNSPSRILVREIASGKTIVLGSDKKITINEFAFSPDNNLILAVTNNDVYKWNLRSVFKNADKLPKPPPQLVSKLVRIEGGLSDGTSMAISPNGKLLAFTTRNTKDSSILLWDFETNSYRNRVLYDELFINKRLISSMLIMPDNRTLVAAMPGPDVQPGIIVFWDLIEHKIVKTINANGDWPSNLSVDSSGQYLLYGEGGNVNVLDTINFIHIGNPIPLGLSRNGRILDIAMNNNGSYASIVTNEKGLLTLSLDWQSLACLMAGRTFTDAEYKEYFSSFPSAKVCQSYPDTHLIKSQKIDK